MTYARLTFHSPGFFSRLREKGAMAKDAWGVIGSAYVYSLGECDTTLTASLVLVYNRQ